MHATRRSDTLASAKAILADMAPSVLAYADKLVEDGSHVWIPDPEVPRVWGLVRSSSRTRADLVVYIDGLWGDGDFECDELFGEDERL